MANQPAITGSTVYSIGNSELDDGLLWRLTRGTVRGRAIRTLQNGSECTILETDAPVNPGDNGGPLVNDRAELVGVVSHFLLDQQLVSGNIDILVLKPFLENYQSSTSPRR